MKIAQPHPPEQADLERLRREYADREQRLAHSDIYSILHPGKLLENHSRQRAALGLLRRHGFARLQNARILELGCGNGGVLLEYLGAGAEPHALHGTDLLPERVLAAHRLAPHLPVTCADGRRLPYANQAFDLVLQYTVFSSVLDAQVRRSLAQEMLRVLRQPAAGRPGGLILWYDFWLNPANRQTRGLRPAEIRGLFPGCRCEFRRIILAPPLARRLAPRAWTLAVLLENLRIFNTHYLAAIRPECVERGL